MIWKDKQRKKRNLFDMSFPSLLILLVPFSSSFIFFSILIAKEVEFSLSNPCWWARCTNLFYILFVLFSSSSSPWSNAYYPAMEDGFLPSPRLRALEIEANKLFDVYRRQYFEGGFSSVYFFDTEEGEDKAFGACFLIHKDVQKEKGLEKGWWDSIHVFEVSQEKKGLFLYKLTTTVMVSLGLSEADKIGNVDLSGSMTKQDERRLPMDETVSTHLSNLGTILEDMELKIRNAIEGIYIQKTREVLNGIRTTSAAREKDWAKVTQSLNQSLSGRGQD